jgi:hypothetical protein
VKLACPARIAFDQSTGHVDHTGTPPALIGSIAHRAMELHLSERAPSDPWTSAVNEAIGSGIDITGLPGLDRAALRFVRRAREATELIDSLAPTDVHLEERLVSADGFIEGTPDVVVIHEDGCTIIDHKTGEVLDTEGVETKEPLETQIRLYASLAEEVHHAPARRGVLLSFRRGAVDVSVSEPELSAARARAAALRHEYNARAPGPQPAIASNETCTWCEHKARCDGFWAAASAGVLDSKGDALCGHVCGSAEMATVGVAAITLEVTIGTSSVGDEVIVAEIPSQIATGLADGDGIALTGLRRAPDDRQVWSFTAASQWSYETHASQP